MTNPAETIEAILAEADAVVRRRLEETGVEVRHVILAVAADGTRVLKSNADTEGLRRMADVLEDIAGQVEDDDSAFPRPTRSG